MEAAPAGRVGRAGQITGEQDPLTTVLDDRVGDRDGRHQRPRVGVQRGGIEVVGSGLLYEGAEIHHADPVADVLDDGEVVGDDEIGQAEGVLQLLQQVDHLGLHRDIERRDRLIGHDQLGVDG